MIAVQMLLSAIKKEFLPGRAVLCRGPGPIDIVLCHAVREVNLRKRAEDYKRDSISNPAPGSNAPAAPSPAAAAPDTVMIVVVRRGIPQVFFVIRCSRPADSKTFHRFSKYAVGSEFCSSVR